MTRHERRLRRAAAVLAGALAIVILSAGTDLALHASGVFPPAGQPMSAALFGLAGLYRHVYAVAGGWISARLAPDHALRHALALGAIGVVSNLAGLVATWDRGPAFGPAWYPLSLVALALPCTWLGGWLAGRRPSH